MPTEKRILLVEGKSDQSFYGEICKSLALDTSVTVAPPRDLGGKKNSKEGLFNFLPIQLKQLADGQIERLAVIVDADSAVTNGLGFEKTVARMTSIVKPFGFLPIDRPNIGGILFGNDDLPDFGLWVMPDNQNDGMLEHWIQAGIRSDDETALMVQARAATSALAAPKFKPIHLAKAEVAVWLGWQKEPGRGMEYAISENLIDQQSEQFARFVGWLRHVFA